MSGAWELLARLIMEPDTSTDAERVVRGLLAKSMIEFHGIYRYDLVTLLFSKTWGRRCVNQNDQAFPHRSTCQ